MGAHPLVLKHGGGVTSYAVSRRRTELGIRMALGAAPAGVVGLVLRRVSILVGLGVIVGSGVSLWLAPLVKALLFGLEPHDPRPSRRRPSSSAVSAPSPDGCRPDERRASILLRCSGKGSAGCVAEPPLGRYAAREREFGCRSRITAARKARPRGSGAGRRGPRKRPSRGVGRSPT
jgi:hypothetical protein